MTYVYVVYRESDACNIAAFTSYDLALRYIDSFEVAEEREDYFIERLQLLNV